MSATTIMIATIVIVACAELLRTRGFGLISRPAALNDKLKKIIKDTKKGDEIIEKT